MNSSGILHLTIDPDGKIRLWDGPQQARLDKGPNEVQVFLTLTAPQIRTLVKAEIAAQQIKRGGRS